MKTDVHIDDIYHDSCRRIFILESPHFEELRTGFPASGASGVVMSSALYGRQEPLGILIGERSVVSDGIINAFQFPLASSVYNEIPAPVRPFLRVKEVPYTNPQSYKSELKKTILGIDSTKEINDFRERVSQAIVTSNVKEIIVCGFISQSMWELAFEGKTIRAFRTWHEHKLQGVDIRLRYSNHPSPRSGKNWEM